MKRKIFVKQLMALGLERNKANSFCKQMLARRDRLRALGSTAPYTGKISLNFLCRACKTPGMGGQNEQTY